MQARAQWQAPRAPAHSAASGALALGGPATVPLPWVPLPWVRLPWVSIWVPVLASRRVLILVPGVVSTSARRPGNVEGRTGQRESILHAY